MWRRRRRRKMWVSRKRRFRRGSGRRQRRKKCRLAKWMSRRRGQVEGEREGESGRFKGRRNSS